MTPAETSTPSLPACPASPAVQLEDEPEPRTNGGCGPTLPASSERCDRVGQFLRIRLASCLIPMEQLSLRYWKPRATKWPTRSCWALAALEARITDIASGWWPTPRAGEHKQGPSSTRKRLERAGASGRSVDWMLSDAVRFNGRHDPEIASGSGKTLEVLNPRWSLQLMGFPADWLDAGAAKLIERSATPSTRGSRKSLPAP